MADVRAGVLLAAGVACVVFALVRAEPVWIGVAGTLLGAEPIVRARDEVKKE